MSVAAIADSAVDLGRKAGTTMRRPDLAKCYSLKPWAGVVYALSHLIFRCISFPTFRRRVLRPHAVEIDEPFILAATHFSHLEPFVLSGYIRRHIDWMSRVEFYRHTWTRIFLDAFGCFPVDRQGVPVRAIRTAIERLNQGRVVGMFPEGGVTVGRQSVCRGGKIKCGVCVIAYRANVPVIPCVVVGTHTLNQVMPWIPFRRARLWFTFGSPVRPDLTLPRKQSRRQMAVRLQQQYIALYQEMLSTYGLDDASVP